jgi:hypothetical protein
MAGNTVPLTKRLAIARAIERRNGKARIREIRQQLRKAKRDKAFDLAFDLAMELDEAEDARPRHGGRS